MSSTASIIEKLSERFDPKVVRMKPAFSGGKPMPYVSHGLVCRRLNQEAPGWSSRILGREIVTVPVTVRQQQVDRTYVEVTLEVTLPDGSYHQEIGVAEVKQDYGTAAKAAASDALKRAAMRHGVALYVWESLEEEDAGDDHHDTAPPGATPIRPARGNGTGPRDAPAPAARVARDGATGVPRPSPHAHPDEPAPDQAPTGRAASPAGPAHGGGGDEPVGIEHFGWTEFWSWAKAQGYRDRGALDAALGRPTTGMTPLEMRRALAGTAAPATASA